MGTRDAVPCPVYPNLWGNHNPTTYPSVPHVERRWGGRIEIQPKGESREVPARCPPSLSPKPQLTVGAVDSEGRRGTAPRHAIKGFAGTLLQLCLNSLATLPLGGLDKH